MNESHNIIDLFVCPLCKAPLSKSHDGLSYVCKAERLQYPIDDGLPLLLEEHAKSLSTDEMNAVLDAK